MNNDHNCIEKTREQIIAADPSIQHVEFELARIGSLSGSAKPYKTGQSLYLHQQKVKKDGTVTQKRIKSFVSHDYCPFCGEKYL